MQVNRNQLKALIKECLVEILNEGLGTLRQPQGGAYGEPLPPRPRISGTQVAASRKPTMLLKSAIKEVAAGDPVMEAIYADTAATTLAAQMAHGDTRGSLSSAPSGPLLKEQFSGAPDQVFGESANRWSELAFAGPSKSQ